MTPGRVPAFEEIEPEVKAEWIADQRAEIKRQAFEAIRTRYEVVLPAPPGNVAGGAAPTPRSLP